MSCLTSFYTLRQGQIVIESWYSCLHSPRGRLRYDDRLRPATLAQRPTLN